MSVSHLLDAENRKKRLHQSKVLVVDDMETNRFIINEILSSDGFLHVSQAENGQVALEKTLSEKPDIIILDLMMPVMDGYDFMRKLRSIAGFETVPILVQTSLDNPEQRTKAFTAGASDLVTKPINADELLARTKLHLDRDFLLKELNLYKEVMESEIKQAWVAQQSLMPSRKLIHGLRQSHALEVFAHTEECLTLGGDIWGVIPLTPTQVAIYLCDVSGHGVCAALHAFRVHTLIHDYVRPEQDTATLMTALNARLHELLPTDYFVTMFYGIIDIASDQLHYTCATYPPPLFVKHASGEVVMLESVNFPLGVVPDAGYQTHCIPFVKGDSLLLYSDALTETNSPGTSLLLEEDFWANHLKGLISTTPNGGKILASVLERFNQHRGGLPLQDDLTIVACQRV
jgi:sigma-B regulation protein RsbU (phosphoserine phosphatase)